METGIEKLTRILRAGKGIPLSRTAGNTGLDGKSIAIRVLEDEGTAKSVITISEDQ